MPEKSPLPRPEWASPDSEPCTIEGIAATSDPLPERGIVLAREALERAVVSFRPQPMRMEHCERIGTINKVWLRERDDGVTELLYEGVAWVPAGVDPHTWIPPGMSIGIMETEARNAGTLILLGADSMTFDDEALDEVRATVGTAPIPIGVERYHQFAALPPPLILIALTDLAIQLFYGVAGAATYDALKAGVGRLLGKSRQPGVPTRIRVRIPDTAEVDFEMPIDPAESLEAIDSVFDGIANLIRASALGATVEGSPGDHPDSGP